MIDKENPTGYSQVIEERGNSGEVKRRYVYGYDLISMTDVSTNKTYYYVYDGIGSVRCVLDEGGNIVNEYDYDGFGVELYALENVENNYKFHGEYKDEDTGLYYLRARWYDVDTGRFYSMDEFEGVYEEPESLHKYVFAGNDGVNRVDYSGMMYVGGEVGGVRMSEVMGERVRELLRGVVIEYNWFTIYVWSYEGFKQHWGHASLKLNYLEVYISWWPKGENRESIVPISKLRNIYSAEAYENRTFAQDIEGEGGRLPDVRINLFKLSEINTYIWWLSFKQIHKWETLGYNCAKTVAEALKYGGARIKGIYKNKHIWTPADVIDYANEIKNYEMLELVY